MSLGVLSRIRIHNLRGQRDLEIRLSPRLNFIVGPPGAGKSSIVTAIRLALGYSRVQSDGDVTLKSLVRRGDDSDGVCVAEIVLSNDGLGLGCLPQDRWGRSIMLRRTIAVLADGSLSDQLEAFADEDEARRIHPRDAAGAPQVLPEDEHRAWLLATLADAFCIRHDNPAQVTSDLDFRAMVSGGASDGSPADEAKYRIVIKVSCQQPVTRSHVGLSRRLEDRQPLPDFVHATVANEDHRMIPVPVSATAHSLTAAAPP